MRHARWRIAVFSLSAAACATDRSGMFAGPEGGPSDAPASDVGVVLGADGPGPRQLDAVPARDGGATPVADAAAPASDRVISPDGGTDAKLDGAAWGLQVVRTVARRDGYIVERVAYQGATGVVFGEICRPDDVLKHAVILRNHGGFEGLAGDSNDGFCRTLAQRGYVVASSSYRGEDGSSGSIEVCLGEVEDVRAMMVALKAQPYVMPDRMGRGA